MRNPIASTNENSLFLIRLTTIFRIPLLDANSLNFYIADLPCQCSSSYGRASAAVGAVPKTSTLNRMVKYYSNCSGRAFAPDSTIYDTPKEAWEETRSVVFTGKCSAHFRQNQNIGCRAFAKALGCSYLLQHWFRRGFLSSLNANVLPLR